MAALHTFEGRYTQTYDDLHASDEWKAERKLWLQDSTVRVYVCLDDES